MFFHPSDFLSLSLCLSVSLFLCVSLSLLHTLFHHTHICVCFYSVCVFRFYWFKWFQNFSLLVCLPFFLSIFLLNQSKIGTAGFFALYLMFGAAAQLVCNVIAVAYPAFISLKALETSTKDDDTKWLTYWVLYAIFSVFEFFTGYLPVIIPFYYLWKVNVFKYRKKTE